MQILAEVISILHSALLEKKIEPRLSPFHNAISFIYVYRILLWFSVFPEETVSLQWIFIKMEKITF